MMTVRWSVAIYLSKSVSDIVIVIVISWAGMSCHHDILGYLWFGGQIQCFPIIGDRFSGRFVIEPFVIGYTPLS
jgi:hypothetical protein